MAAESPKAAAPSDSESRALRVGVHWFRQDLRLHDNIALDAAVKACDVVYFVFIFDGSVASSSNAGFNRFKFLVDSVRDVDRSLQTRYGTRLHFFRGDAVDVLERQIKLWKVGQLSFEAEVEPIWKERDDAVKHLCLTMDVTVVEKVGHTLWDPLEILKANGGSPPLTFAVFNHVLSSLPLPARPLECLDLADADVPVSENYETTYALQSQSELFAGHEQDSDLPEEAAFNRWEGGETAALILLRHRLVEEEMAFRSGLALPNQYKPDLLGSPKSLSGHLKFGCLSVRRFYWSIHDIYRTLYPDRMPPIGITGQLVWREYFYTMSVNNPNYGQIMDNPICIPIRWYEKKEEVEAFRKGQTGYPWIDAIVNQLRREGWIHHVCRHILACFLTRGDLWLSWEEGLRIFERYLIDYDWSICAGNWMWVSSSAFEKALDCPHCFDPVRYGVRMDPTGEYVRRYVPALRRLPLRYLFQPWLAPRAVQEEAGCVVGRDYPTRICDHQAASARNMDAMKRLRALLIARRAPHCRPSDDGELRRFVWLPDRMVSGERCTGDDLCAGIDGL